MNLMKIFPDEGISLTDSLDFMSDGIVIVNQDLKIVFINNSGLAILGISPEGNYVDWPREVGLYEMDRKTLIDPEELPLVKALRGNTVTAERLYLNNEKLETWVCLSCNASPILKGNKKLGAVVTFRDITESLAQEDRIQKEREAYHKILDSLPDYVFSKDLNGNFTFVNEKFNNDFIKIFDDIPAKDFIIENMKRNFDAHNAEVVSQAKPLVAEEILQHPHTGDKKVYRTTRIPLIDKDQNVYGICGIATDITETKAKKKKMEEERGKIQKASKLAALGLLAAEIGHEINNPLAIIRTGSWILRKMILSPKFNPEAALAKLDDIDQTIQRISDIVVSVKNLSRDSSEEKMEPSALRDIFRDVHAICSAKLVPRGVKMNFDFSNPLLDVKVNCFRVQLSEVFINLLGNAVDAIADRPEPAIDFELLTKEDHLIMRISDNGPGVPEEMDKKIFKPFFSTKALGHGTGLGLSISRQIMKKHGGELIFNRNVSPSCFEVCLPLTNVL
jgi:nitrogen-specific signal transduction histidine kinase